MDELPGKNDELNHFRAKGSVSFKSAARMIVSSGSVKMNVNEPVHAALGKDLDENQMRLSSEESLIRNRALLHYMATLAISNSETDKFNYEFVQSLLDGGGNLNEAMDGYGQTIFHEVARSWNLDVARFLLKNGANVNQKDKYGRSPLHVCAAADHCDMVEFLLHNGADIDSRSEGDEQTPLHFAAKNDAANSLIALLGFGANIDSLDKIGRTPLQVASELSRDVSVRHLIEEGASSCIYDVNGNSSMTFLAEKLPHLALEALDQLHVSDTITRNELFYLNLLEESRQKQETKKARTPLETAVINRQFNVLMHPVMNRLIDVKWQQYGKFGTFLDLIVNVLYAILFTIFAVGTPGKGMELYSPAKSKSWRVLIGIVLIVVTVYQMYLQIRTTIQSREKQNSWIKWRVQQLKGDLQYCHPKWQEEKYIRDEIKLMKGMPLLSTMDAWFFFDWLVIVLILLTISLNLAYYLVDTNSIRSYYVRVLSILLVLVWLRILKYLRPFPGIGTLVLILGATGGDFVNWGFFFLLLFIPFSSCFWIIFGGLSENNVDGFTKVPRLIYTIVQISVGEDFNIDGMTDADPVMARLLSAVYITAMVIICLNILIAYLSNTFTLVYSNAVENTTMQRAINILNVERFLTKVRKQKYFNFIRKNASPETVQSSVVDLSDKRSAEKTAKQFRNNFERTHAILMQRFKRRVGRAKKSTFDILLRDVDRLKTGQNKTVSDLQRIQDCVEQLGLLLCGNPMPKMHHLHDVAFMVQRSKDGAKGGGEQKHKISAGLPEGRGAAFLLSQKTEVKKKKKAATVAMPPLPKVEMDENADETDGSDDDEEEIEDTKTVKQKTSINLPQRRDSKSKQGNEKMTSKKVRFNVDNHAENESQESKHEKNDGIERRPHNEVTNFDDYPQPRSAPGHEGPRQTYEQEQFQQRQHLQSHAPQPPPSQFQDYSQHQMPRHTRRSSSSSAENITTSTLVPYTHHVNPSYSNLGFTLDPNSQENWDYWERISADSISL